MFFTKGSGKLTEGLDLEGTDFAAAFLERLASNAFHDVGSMTDYLALPASRRTGDEANIVDLRVTRALLESLGYQAAEINYNVGKDNLRPDYEIRIARYPDCCFVVEDKTTTEMRLESHRSQLESYMSARRAARGLLVNGSRLIGYDDTGPATSATIDFSLANAVRSWQGDATGRSGWDALAQADQDTLTVIARRYGRLAFEGVAHLIDDLTLDRDGNPHASDGSTWQAGVARLPLTDARDGAQHLVASIQDLIGELRSDVAVQFAARRQEYETFRTEVAHAPGSTVLAETIMDDISARTVSLVPNGATDRRDRLAHRLRQAMRGERPVSEIQEVIAEIRSAVGGRGNPGAADPLSRVAQEASNFARRYSRHRSRARERCSAGVETMEAYDRWQSAVGTLMLAGASQERANAEYFTQTAYLIIVRMLLVRVFEDKGLMPRVFTNGGAALWFREVEPHYFSMAIGRSPARLLQVAYENAQATYAHFYEDHRVFDWYVPDRNTIVRVLHQLASFNLSTIDRDIVGTVYGRFVNEQHKHEQGMYYTPQPVVAFILDRVGWQGRATVGARLLDPACGSGAFLVEAARRAVAAYRAQALADGHPEIPPDRIQSVLNSLRNGLVGFDLNPFACALAEINLLVQVLDLIVYARNGGYPVHLDRFHIYSTDALQVMPSVRAELDAGLDQTEAGDLPEEEQAKARIGRYAEGFDVVVGNPPYVRADEGAAGFLEYRRRVEDHPIQQVRDVLVQKWDLFVPFVALGLHLLRTPGGRLGMIVSNAVETVLYAGALRRQLTDSHAVQEVHFFDRGVKLFDDASVRNTIVVAETGTPGDTVREWHGGPPPLIRRRQILPQAVYGEDVFRSVLPSLRVPAGVNAQPVKHICYASVGMVLNANEKLARGQFKLDDLLSARHDAIHCKPYVGSEDLRIPDSLAGDFLFSAARIHYLEYGTTRVPGQIRRPTFPELYDRDKVMAGEFGGALYDDGTLDTGGYLACNHSVFLFVPWHLLAGVRNRSLADQERKLRLPRSRLEEISRLFPLPFLAGLFNSTAWECLMEGRESSSISGRSQPVNYADQMVPVPDADLATAVGMAAQAASQEGRALAALLSAGWQRHKQGWRAPPLLPITLARAPLAIARARWALTIEQPNVRCGTLRLDGITLLSGKRVAARFGAGTPPAASAYLLRMLVEQGSATLQAVESSGLIVPLRPEDAENAERALLAAEQEAMAREETIVAYRTEIDRLISPMFEAVSHPPVHAIEPLMPI